MNYQRVTRVNSITVALEQQEEYQEPIKWGLEGMSNGRTTTDPPCIRYATLVDNRKVHKLQSLESRHAGPVLSENNPASTKNEVKWQAQANTRVSINPNQVSIYRESCREYKHIPAGNKASRKADVDKTSYTSSDYSHEIGMSRG